MSKTLPNLKYAKTDEWFDPATGKIGISDYAQGQLSDIVFLEITVNVGDTIAAGQAIASVESVKAASDVLAPASGQVVAINETLASSPENLNSEAYGAWLIQVEGAAAADLLDAAEYEAHCAKRH